MADLYASAIKPISLYKDRRYSGGFQERERKLHQSRTLYVGNLSFYTSEEQVFDLFSKCGEIKRIIMGLDRIRKTPCGFCFVEYFTRADAEKSVFFLCDMKLDERTIRVDYDIGFEEGRQYGRGKSGGQVRDEHRIDYDPGRGGYGKAAVSGPPMSAMDMWGADANQPPPPHFDPPPRFEHRDDPRRGRGRGRGRRGSRPRFFPNHHGNPHHGNPHHGNPHHGPPPPFAQPSDWSYPHQQPPPGLSFPPHPQLPHAGSKRSGPNDLDAQPALKRPRSDAHDRRHDFHDDRQIHPHQQPVGHAANDSR